MRIKSSDCSPFQNTIHFLQQNLLGQQLSLSLFYLSLNQFKINLLLSISPTPKNDETVSY